MGRRLRSEVSRFSSFVFSPGQGCASLGLPEGCGDGAAFEPDSDLAVLDPWPSEGVEEGAFCGGLVRLLVFEPDEDGRLDAPEAFGESDLGVLALAVCDFPDGALAGNELSVEVEWALSLPSISAWYAVFTYKMKISVIDHSGRTLPDLDELLRRVLLP